MSDWLPATLAVTTTLGRVLLAATCLGIFVTSAAVVTIHNAEYGITAHRASLLAIGGVVVSIAALAAALLISPSY